MTAPLMLYGCGGDDDGNDATNGNYGRVDKIEYSFFDGSANGNNESYLGRTDVVLKTGNVSETTATIIGQDTDGLDTTPTIYLKRNYQFQTTTYIDSRHIDPDTADYLTVDDDEIELVYPSVNGGEIELENDVEFVDISGKSILTSGNAGANAIAVEGISYFDDSLEFVDALSQLSFPNGSECVMIHEDTDFDPYYSFDFKHYSADTDEVEPATVKYTDSATGAESEFTTLEDLLIHAFWTGTEYEIDSVGLNNDIRVMRVYDNSVSLKPLVFAEYENLVYYAKFHTPASAANQSRAKCANLNDVAADYIEAQMKTLF